MRSVQGLLWLSVCGMAVVGCQSTPALRPQTEAQKPATSAPAKTTGTGRVAVEHSIDPQAASVDLTPQKITVEDLISKHNHDADKIDLANYKTRRIAPFETSTYEVDAKIKNIKHEKDGDYYLVIQGKSGAQGVVEVPDPALCQGSPLLPKITAMRKALEDRYHPTDTPKDVNDDATIEGVGFLGSRRQKGSGSFGHGSRLMPGTGVKFSDKKG